MDGDGEAWELMLRSGVEEFDKTSPAHCVDAQERVARLVAMLKEFDEAPFTLQRLCELIAEPHRFFRTTDSFLFGLDKLCSVSSTMQPATMDKVDRLQAAFAAVVDARRSAAPLPPPPPPARLQSPPSPPLEPRQSNGVELQDWFDA